MSGKDVPFPGKVGLLRSHKVIEQKTYLIREQKVIFDRDLAELYGVETRVLIQAVKRNKERFPDDFMFQLTDNEYINLKSQFVISSWGGSRRAKPYALTEQGVAILSSVLKSDRAIKVNIQIIRSFVRLRKIMASHKGLSHRLDELEQKYDSQFRVISDAIRALMSENETPKQKIGFTAKEKQETYKTQPKTRSCSN